MKKIFNHRGIFVFAAAIASGALVILVSTVTLIQAHAQLQTSQNLQDAINSAMNLVWSVIAITGTVSAIIAFIATKLHLGPQAQKALALAQEIKNWTLAHESQIRGGVEAAASLVPKLQQQIILHRATIDDLTQKLNDANARLAQIQVLLNSTTVASPASSTSPASSSPAATTATTAATTSQTNAGSIQP